MPAPSSLPAPAPAHDIVLERQEGESSADFDAMLQSIERKGRVLVTRLSENVAGLSY